MKLTIATSPASLARVKPSTRDPLRVALVQTRWHENATEHRDALRSAIKLAAEAGAKIVFLPELTLSRYPADTEPYPVYDLYLDGVHSRVGLPTCWDEWFPEVARNYSLRGAEILAYPTAIGSEPDHPEFDTEPLWQKVIVANGIANGTFMVVPNRWGNEGTLNFYGSSFISDPYGRVLARAGRDTDEVLVADLDLDQRRDWLDLFPFLATRRPDTYSALVDPVSNARTDTGDGEHGGIAGERR